MKDEHYTKRGVSGGQKSSGIHIVITGNDKQRLKQLKERLSAFFQVEVLDFASLAECAFKPGQLVLLDGSVETSQLKEVRSVFGEHLPFIVYGTSALTSKERIEVRSYGVINFLDQTWGDDELIAVIRNVVRFTVLQHQEKGSHLPFQNQVEVAIEVLLRNRPPFGVQDLSEQLGLSHSTLYRKVKNTFDQSPNRLIAARRSDKAAHLLAKTNLNITEIAYACGFSSATYLARTFKQFYGVTPGQFRKEVRELH